MVFFLSSFFSDGFQIVLSATITIYTLTHYIGSNTVTENHKLFYKIYMNNGFNMPDRYNKNAYIMCGARDLTQTIY